MALRIRCDVNEEDVVRAGEVLLSGKRRRMLVILLAAPLVVFLVANIMEWWSEGSFMLESFNLFFIVGLYVVVFLFYSFIVLQTRRSTREAFVNRAPPESATFLEVSEEGLRFETGGSWVMVPWERVTGWKEDDQLILVADEDYVYRIIPTRCLATKGDWEYVTDLLRKKVGASQ